MNPTLPSPRFGEVAALAALGLLVVTLSVSPITNYDVFLHLKTGSVILETGHVPLTDDYSALARGRPFVAHEWLSEVLFRVIERGFGTKGFPALICLTSVVALLIAASLYGAARLLGASPVIAVPMLALAMVLAGARLNIAPHIFSYLMIAVVLLLLAGRRAGRRIPLWSFLPLQIVWANLHGGFLLGPAIVGLAAIGEAVESRLGRRGAAPPGQEARRLALLALAQVAVSLVNPYGVRLLLFPFQLMGSDFMKEIYEWRPPFGSTYAASYMARYYVAWIVLGAGAILGGVLVARRRRTAPSAGVFGLLLFVFFLALSLRMNRVVTDFALASCPWLASTLTCIAGGTPRRVFRESALFVTALALAGLAFWFGQNGYPFRPGDVRPFGFGITDNTPVLAADYLERNDVRGNIFNSYDVTTTTTPTGTTLRRTTTTHVRTSTTSTTAAACAPRGRSCTASTNGPCATPRPSVRFSSASRHRRWSWAGSGDGTWRPRVFSDRWDPGSPSRSTTRRSSTCAPTVRGRTWSHATATRFSILHATRRARFAPIRPTSPCSRRKGR